MQALCRSFVHQIALRTARGALRPTSIRRQLITQIKVPPGTRIRVNNNRHRQALLHHQLGYDLHRWVQSRDPSVCVCVCFEGIYTLT